MSRVKIQLPSSFSFSTSIPLRITDINYGGHLGNDAVLSLVHEARMQFLRHHGFSELDFGGIGMIMADAAIEFKNEAFYGDVLTAAVTAVRVSRVSFDIFYQFKTASAVVAIAKTGMVCFDYSRKKIVAIPEDTASVFAA